MKLFGRKRDSQTKVPEAPPCLHIGLTARWDSIDDMGNEEKATSFVCATCGKEFTPAEAAEIRSSQAEQLRKDLGAA
jgi:DNA-directed RNA polymerase subunit RPC12/RpoP